MYLRNRKAIGAMELLSRITLPRGDAAYDPFGQDDTGLGVTILKKMARRLDYRLEGGCNVIDIIL